MIYRGSVTYIHSPLNPAHQVRMIPTLKNKLSGVELRGCGGQWYQKRRSCQATSPPNLLPIPIPRSISGSPSIRAAPSILERFALSVWASCHRVSGNEFVPSLYRVSLGPPRILCVAIYCLYCKDFHTAFVQMASRNGLFKIGLYRVSVDDHMKEILNSVKLNRSEWRDAAWRGATCAPEQLVIIQIWVPYRAREEYPAHLSFIENTLFI